MSTASIRACWSPARGIVVSYCASLNVLLSEWEPDTLRNNLVRWWFMMTFSFFHWHETCRNWPSTMALIDPRPKPNWLMKTHVHSWFSIVQIVHCLVISYRGYRYISMTMIAVGFLPWIPEGLHASAKCETLGGFPKHRHCDISLVCCAHLVGNRQAFTVKVRGG